MSFNPFMPTIRGSILEQVERELSLIGDQTQNRTFSMNDFIASKIGKSKSLDLLHERSEIHFHTSMIERLDRLDLALQRYQPQNSEEVIKKKTLIKNIRDSIRFFTRIRKNQLQVLAKIMAQPDY